MLREEVLDVIEICWMAIPTLYRLISTRKAEARDLALNGILMLNKLNKLNHKRTQILKAKLHLFLASIYIEEKKHDDNRTIITEELDSIETVCKYIHDEEAIKALKFYKQFTLAIFYSKMLRKHKHEITNLEENQKKLSGLLNACNNSLKGLAVEYEIEKAKVDLLEAKVMLQSPFDISSPLQERVKKSIGTFKSSGLKRLEIRANYLYVQIIKKYYFYIILSLLSIQRQEDSLNKPSESLIEAKNHYLIENALGITHLVMCPIENMIY